MLGKEVALRILQFLDGTPLRGNEAPEFMQCVAALRQITDAPEASAVVHESQPNGTLILTEGSKH